MLNVVISEHNLKSDQIYNMDETGFSTIQSKTEKILAIRGRKQLTSAKRGAHFSTTVCCVNAIGNVIPPAFVFPRKKMKNELMDEAFIGSVGYANETGYIILLNYS